MAKTVVGVEVKVDGKQAEQSVGNFKKQLREANADLVTMSEKFGATSREAIEAAKRVGKLKDAIGDAKALADAFSPDAKFAAFSQSINGVVAGFSALQGAQALFGTESEELQKTLLKVQSAMALSQGLNGVLAAKDSFTNLAAVIKSSVIGSLTTLRGALIATGIGAFAVALGLIISNFEKVKTAIYNTIPGMKTIGDAIGGLIDKVKRWAGVSDDAAKARERLDAATGRLRKSVDAYGKQMDFQLMREIQFAKIRGASAEELYQIERKNYLQRIQMYDSMIAAARAKGAVLVDIERERNNLIDEMETKMYDRQIARIEEQKKKQAEVKKESLPKVEQRDFEFERLEMLKTADNDYTQTLLANKEAIDKRRAESAEAARLYAEWEVKAEEEKLSYLTNITSTFADIVGRQTAAGKALAIASATINTYKAASEALKANYGAFGPAAQVARFASVAATIAMGLKQVKAIASTKVPGVGGGSGGSVAAPSLAGLSPQAATTRLDQTSINQIGNAAGRAFVLETDVTNNQERIRRLNRAARIN